MTKETILVTGANGQIGTVLTNELRKIYGNDNVIASDIIEPIKENNPFIFLDILNTQRLHEKVKELGVTQIYHLAAILSASGEWNPLKTWNINLNGLLSILDLGEKSKTLKKIFFPSTIAVYGPNTPRINTPQHCYLDPSTVYGISKSAGELWCNYYHNRYGVDIRSIRYPGIIGYQSIPSGGTTDYAVEIFHAALKDKHYDCFLEAETRLPMMYMPDAIRATIELMESPKDAIKERTSYNLAAMSFTPQELYREICEHIPDFTIDYKPDQRQNIANSWSESIDDSAARTDWNWNHNFDIKKMATDMIKNLKPQYE